MLSIPINIYIVVGYVLILLVCSDEVLLVCASTEPDFHYFNFVHAIFCGLAVDFSSMVHAKLLHAECQVSLATSHIYASAVERSPNFCKYCGIVKQVPKPVPASPKFISCPTTPY